MFWTLATMRRQSFAVSAIIFITISLLVYTQNYARYKRRSEVGNSPADSRMDITAVDGSDVAGLCRRHGLRLYGTHGSGQRKIYDLFLFSHELDWLEIRLETLSAFVDYFVIVEAETTFTGVPKPLYLRDNWSKFTEFHHKIIHRVVADSGLPAGSSTWQQEDYFRNSLFHSTFPTLMGSEQEAHEGDVLIVSDVDEIPKPNALQVLRQCHIPDRLTLRSHFYYYSFQWQHVGEQWAHPQATTFHGLHRTLSPNHLRNGIGGVPGYWPLVSAFQRWWQTADMWDSAWHCSSCFATTDEMRTKMSSFSHTPLNTAENRDDQIMMHRVRNGLDLFGRPRERYERIENNQDVPEYILKHRSEFEYLLDRDGENAGFRNDMRPT